MIERQYGNIVFSCDADTRFWEEAFEDAGWRARKHRVGLKEETRGLALPKP
jgi:hypothetical protein